MNQVQKTRYSYIDSHADHGELVIHLETAETKPSQGLDTLGTQHIWRLIPTKKTSSQGASTTTNKIISIYKSYTSY